MLAVPTLAVVNTHTKTDAKREAPFEVYGPPPVQTPQAANIPAPVYGVPAQANYPLPPPDKLPSKEYGKFIWCCCCCCCFHQTTFSSILSCIDKESVLFACLCVLSIWNDSICYRHLKMECERMKTKQTKNSTKLLNINTKWNPSRTHT